MAGGDCLGEHWLAWECFMKFFGLTILAATVEILHFSALRVRVMARSMVALRMGQVRSSDLNAQRRIYKIISVVRPPCSATILWL